MNTSLIHHLEVEAVTFQRAWPWSVMVWKVATSTTDSALGETNVIRVDSYLIWESGTPHMSVLCYCDDILHFWKAKNWCGIHLYLQEPCALPAPLGWHCRHDCLHHLSWLGPAGRPLWAFLRFAPLETSRISQFPTPPPVCPLFQLVLASSSFRCLIQHLVVIWYLQMWW